MGPMSVVNYFKYAENLQIYWCLSAIFTNDEYDLFSEYISPDASDTFLPLKTTIYKVVNR